MRAPKLIALMLAGASVVFVAGCANTSADVYNRDQMMRAATVQSGAIENLRSVKMEDSTGVGTIAGGAIGGIAAGTNIGGGNGQIISGIIGALVGGLAGNAIEKGVTQQDAYEVTVRLDNGQRIVVVQKADTPLAVGQRVDVLTDSKSTRIVPASNAVPVQPTGL
ncbi:lipoprotein [Jeongeupia sp. HS-3]|uniref:outer membrane lipoprotein n=1 Tax=Jeongeupia sp. HS-3 TaxID=1009682 RepID=UPI0018A60009|nr:glycine zipper 2TM domain-containing protein [Jeongeupia sp. HS-3]BCL76600.1 lipoprotein [Jeongeupia sp. HS-3]